MKSVSINIRAFSNLPRPVVMALGGFAVSGLVFAAAQPLLGGALESAIATNASLTRELQDTNTQIRQAQDDHAYVVEHLERYDALLKSDRLVPHTRRTAVAELQRVARARGLTKLDYSFSAAGTNSLKSAAAQSTSKGYRVSVEIVTLSVAAPLDGSLYGFISDIGQSFPGSAVVETVQINRVPRVSDADLRAVSTGTGGLVSGGIMMTWRTAQAEESSN